MYNKPQKNKIMDKAIVLLPVDHYDRKEHAEKFEDTTFENVQEIADTFLNVQDEVLIFRNLSIFMGYCNDQLINLENYWLTYVNIKS